MLVTMFAIHYDASIKAKDNLLEESKREKSSEDLNLLLCKAKNHESSC